MMKRKDRCNLNTKLNAERAHKLAIDSLHYLMQFMPDPVILRKTFTAKPYTFPEVEGLCKSRTWSVEDRVAVTMCFMNCSKFGGNIAAEGTLAKAIRKYLPEGILLSPEWFNNEKRIRCKEVAEAVEEFRDWYDQYMLTIENLLSSLYLDVGDRNGKQFIEVLQRRFRANWNPNSMAFKASFESKKEASNDEAPKDEGYKVSFTFTTMEGHPIPEEAKL